MKLVRKWLIGLCICLLFFQKVSASEDFVTRADIIAMVNNNLELNGTTDVNFSDVDKTDWFYRDIAIAVKNNYIFGFSDKSIRPDKYITKEEVGSLISRFLIINKLDNQLEIQDETKISPWCFDAIKPVVDNKIMNLDNNKFFPKRHIIQKEAKEYILNLKRYKEENLLLDEPGIYDLDNKSFKNIYVNSNDVFIKNFNGRNILISGEIKNFSIKNSSVEKIIINAKEKRLVLCNLEIKTSVKLNVIKEEISISSKENNSFELCEQKGFIIALIDKFSDIKLHLDNNKFKLNSDCFVDTLTIKGNKNSSTIKCELNSKVNNLIVDEKSIFTGLGNIIFAKGKALDESTFERLPKNLRRVKRKPKKVLKSYKVDFYDINKKVVKSEIIKQGRDATPPKLENIDGYIFESWDKGFSNINEDLSIYPIYKKLEEVGEIKINEIGTMGKLTGTTNTYKIDDNSSLGFKTLVIKKDRLPNPLNKYKRFEIVINDLILNFEENIFDSSYLIVNINQFTSTNLIKDSLLKAYLE